VYPKPGGLLEWAATDLGDKLCWATEGPPDTWRVVVWPRHSDELGEYPMRAVELLYGLLSGPVTCPMLVQPVVPVLWFDPWHELSETYVDLVGGEQPYRTRLRLLRQALAPTADRSGWPADEEPDDDDRQDKFAAVERGWRLMYEIHDGRQTIRVDDQGAVTPCSKHPSRKASADVVTTRCARNAASPGSPPARTRGGAAQPDDHHALAR
jgi:hypothetical protein